MFKTYFEQRKLLWVEPSHFQLGQSLHSMADIEVSRNLAKKGVSTSLIVPRSQKSFFCKTENAKVNTISIPLKHFPIFSAVFYAVVLLFYLPICVLSLNPNYIMTAPDVSILSFVPNFFICKLKHVKLVLDVRSVPVETFGFVGFLQKFWFTLSLQLAKRISNGLTVITHLMKSDIANQYGFNPDKVGVWTSGVSVELFKADKDGCKAIDIREDCELSDRFVVFYHGVFTSSRGLKETIKSIGLLRDRNYDVVFFLLGKGPYLSILNETVRQNHLEENVVIHSQVAYEGVPPFIQMSDVCIVPLPNSPFWRTQSPLKLLEYLAMEKVVILTDIPAHKLVVGDSRCGIYISSGTPEAIANSIVFALQNRRKLTDWGKLGRKIVCDEYTWDKVAEDLRLYLLSIERS